ncbi:hypothetical protein [Streptomyces sp. NPDC050738]|uniref:hypothetical protein n=1 Tax=Streptomyces sp. NPDC050738 TaxID=3154744 RepID=UPI003413C800
MTTPATPRKAPPLDCAPSQIGPCAHCQQPCRRYGVGARTLCDSCWADVEARRTKAT